MGQLSFFVPGGTVNLILLAIAFSSPAAHAARLPIYRQPAPEHVCALATDIEKHAGSCDDNRLFLKQAQDCWEQVKQIHDQATKEFRSRISGNATGGQGQDFGTSKADQEEAVAAHDYMLKVAETALDDLDKYFDYVVVPDDIDSMTDDQVLATPCYHDAVVPMDGIAEQMEDKIDEMKASKGMEALMGKTSASRQSNTTSLTQSVSGAQAPGNDTPKAKKGSPKNGASTITGVDEDKKKQNK